MIILQNFCSILKIKTTAEVKFFQKMALTRYCDCSSFELVPNESSLLLDWKWWIQAFNFHWFLSPFELKGEKQENRSDQRFHLITSFFWERNSNFRISKFCKLVIWNEKDSKNPWNLKWNSFIWTKTPIHISEFTLNDGQTAKLIIVVKYSFSGLIRFFWSYTFVV